MMYENLFDDMCIAKSSIMGKYLDTPQGSLKEDTYHFGIDAHYYKFIVTEQLKMAKQIFLSEQ